jgi:hypothetical protein
VTRVAFVPPTPLLLHAYAGQVDPVPDLRAATGEAVRWLVAAEPLRVAVICDPVTPDERARGLDVGVAERVAADLLADVGYHDRWAMAGEPTGEAVLVMANGSARRGEHAPGYVDDRAFGFDEALVKAIADGDAQALAGTDAALGEELMAAGTRALKAVGSAALEVREATVHYADDPFGVQYWVATWELETRP